MSTQSDGHMNVLQVIGYLGAGGDTTTVLNAMSAIPDSEVHFDFLTHAGAVNQDAVDSLREAGHRVYILDGDVRALKLGYVPAFVSAVREGGVQYDAVHVHTSMQSGFALLAAKRLGVRRRICHSHVGAIQRRISGVQRRVLVPAFRRLYLSNATELVACSKVAGDFLFGSHPYRVLYNGVDVERFGGVSPDEADAVRRELGCDPETILVGHVAHFSPPKNQSFTLKIADRLRDESRIRFVFVGGQGEDYRATVAEAEKLGLQDSVIFAGQRKDMSRIMRALDCLVLPSLPGEGFPMTIVEAVAAGTPCIASANVTSEVEMLGDSFVRRLELSVEEWAGALRSVKRKTNTSVSGGIRALRANGLDLGSFARSWESLYR